MAGRDRPGFFSMPITIERQVEAAEREVVFRRRVYARLVQSRRMTQKKADEEIAVMEAIVATLRLQMPPQLKQVALPYAGP